MILLTNYTPVSQVRKCYNEIVMLLPSNFENRRSYPESVLDSLTYEVIGDHMQDLTTLDGLALRETLVPHRGLPTYDPAGYLIAYRDLISPKSFDRYVVFGQEDTYVDLKSGYDLGVVFASSLLKRVQRTTGVLPLVISEELDPDKKKLIETYLHASDKLSVKKLTGNDSRTNKALSEGLEQFLDHCRLVVPELVGNDGEELKRGCHDFLSIVALLEAGTDNQERVLKRYLGQSSLLRTLHIKH